MISRMKSKSPLVSVVITTRNSAPTLPALLSSIKGQSYSGGTSSAYRKIEIIVVDNNSSDKTAAIARGFTTKVFNKGPERSAQRNFGVAKSKGRYLFILDSDMELTKNVVRECVLLTEREGAKAIIIPEKTVGEGFIQNIRKFEREMYEGDSTIELARFYPKKIFLEVGGYDERLTGPEDYDLFYRVRKTVAVGRIKSYILHHEEGLTLTKLLQKKFYYASKGALYAQKHPELVSVQGTILFRKSYLRNWRKFIRHPVTGVLFLIVRTLETIWAVSGYISTVGMVNFLKKLYFVVSPNTGKSKD